MCIRVRATPLSNLSDNTKSQRILHAPFSFFLLCSLRPFAVNINNLLASLMLNLLQKLVYNTYKVCRIFTVAVNLVFSQVTGLL